MLNPVYAVVRAGVSLTMLAVAMSGMFASIMVLEPATREFGVGRGSGALPYTLYMIGFGVGNILLGRLLDRYGMLLLAVTGAISLPAGLYLASQADSLWTLSLVLAVVCGCFGGAFAFGPLVADISHWFHRRRGLAVGIVISGSYVAGAIWPPLIQAWIDGYGWRTTFVILAGISLVTMGPLCLGYLRRLPSSMHDADARNDPDWDRPLGLTKPRLQGCLCLAGIGCCVAMAMPQIHITPLVVDLGFRARDGAYMLALMLGFGVVSRITSGWISDRIGGRKTLALGSALQGLAIVLFMFADTLTALYAVSVIFGLAQGGIVPSYSIIIRRFFLPGEAGRRISLTFVFTIGGMALGGWMAGALYDLTGAYTLSFINAIAFNVMNLALALFLMSREPIPRLPAGSTAA